MTPGTAGSSGTIVLDAEKIRIVTSDGTNVTQCVRGYASTTAAPHATGTSFFGIDALHLNSVPADVFLGRLVVQWLRSR